MWLHSVCIGGIYKTARYCGMVCSVLRRRTGLRDFYYMIKGRTGGTAVPSFLLTALLVKISDIRSDMRQRTLFVTSGAAWDWNKMLLG